jgi:hypothetical protein
MTAFLTLLIGVSVAFAGGDKSPREKGGKKVVGPPLRIGSYAALRGGATTGVGFEFNTQVASSPNGRVGLDFGIAGSTLQRVSNFQPLRQYSTVAVLVDGVYALTPGINVGPSVSLAFRPYQQDWWAVDGTWIPMVGFRATTGLLTSRTWQMQLVVNGTVDVVQTRMVFATAEIQNLNPMELQLGVRWLFARQRSPLAPVDES